MTYTEAISYLTGRAWQGSRLGLERIGELLDRMGNPEKNLRFVHVAGTNGKGSTSAISAQILREAGYRTGLYTSPFLLRFNERMQVNGEEISDESLREIVELVQEKAEEMQDHPTEFELVTAVAFAYFAKEQCDIVVLEVGLGGRLDATNVISKAEVAVITRIGLDHTAELGDTVEKIATEKAGIIKPGCDVLLYQQEAEIMTQIKEICTQRAAVFHPVDFSSLHLLESGLWGQSFDYKGFHALKISLLGAHQLRNAAVAIEIILLLRKKGFPIPDQAVVDGLQKVKWPGRFEVLRLSPPFLVDGGHNPQCIETVVQNMRDYFPGKKPIFLLGVLRDKAYEEMIALLMPLAEQFVVVTPKSSRTLPGEELAEKIREQGGTARVCSSVAQGVSCAQALAGQEKVVCALGSLYMTGEIRLCFGLL